MANGDSGRGRANYPRSLISSPRPPCACSSTLTSAMCRPVQYIGHNRASSRPAGDLKMRILAAAVTKRGCGNRCQSAPGCSRHVDSVVNEQFK